MPQVSSQLFADRAEAGALLAARFAELADRDDVIVLGLPRGGVPIAHEVARALRAPLDVFVVRKLGVPGHEELAMGAIASGGVKLVNHDVVDALEPFIAVGLWYRDFAPTSDAEVRELLGRSAS